jgi:hypothetical protein
MENERKVAATNGDFQELCRLMKCDLEDLRAHFNARFDAFERRIEQLLSDTEARIIASTDQLVESMRQ